MVCRLQDAAECSRHYSVAERITSNGSLESPYHYGVRSLPILSTLAAFDNGILGLIDVESRFRTRGTRSHSEPQ